MNPIKTVAILLIVAGALALGYGGFSYTRTTHRADLGDLHLEVKEQEHVNIPLWAGIAAIAAGALLLVNSRKG